MSRSSEIHQYQRNVQRQQQAAAAAAATAAASAAAMSLYGSRVTNMTYDANGFLVPVMQYAPIPLTGDEDDIDDPTNRKSTIPIHGNSTTYNINSLLHQNILVSDYFKALYALRTYHEVLDEIRAVVFHVEPWQTGTSRLPSSAFCLLLKLLVMKMTFKQMNGILNTEDNPFVRAIGFLYLRYTCPPADLWKWFEPYLDDEMEIQPASDKSIHMTIGSYCIKLLTDMQYYGTPFPRIPVLTERKIKICLLLFEEKVKRREKNHRYESQGLLKPGMKVKAIYSDDENEPAWYDAVIDYKDNDSNKYLVTFPEYGNQSSVELGEIDLSETIKVEKVVEPQSQDRDNILSRSRSRERRRSRSRDRRSRRSQSPRRDRRSRSPSENRGSSTQNLMEKVLQSSREASAAVGKNYGHRPVSYKGALSLKVDTFTARKRSPDRPTGYRRRSRSPDRRKSDNKASSEEEDHSSSKVISTEQLERMKKLKEIYGDASKSSS